MDGDRGRLGGRREAGLVSTGDKGWSRLVTVMFVAHDSYTFRVTSAGLWCVISWQILMK